MACCRFIGHSHRLQWCQWHRYRCWCCLFEQLEKQVHRCLALAATAMAGSLGLFFDLVCGVGCCSQQIGHNRRAVREVFVFLERLLCCWWRCSFTTKTHQIAPFSESLLKTRVRPLISCFLVFVGAMLLYGVLLDIWINEHTAPLILPGICCCWSFWSVALFDPICPSCRSEGTVGDHCSCDQ